jgi:hypothetical protein
MYTVFIHKEKGVKDITFDIPPGYMNEHSSSKVVWQSHTDSARSRQPQKTDYAIAYRLCKVATATKTSTTTKQPDLRLSTS